MHSVDLGSIAPDTRIQGITLAFSRTSAQQADLTSLIAAQQNPSSPLFHQWLTPAQFGARFGVSANDLAATESWLQSQGFTIDAVSPSRESITFSGTAASVASAFGAPIHYFRSNSDAITHYAPANDLTVPAALGNVVLAVANLSNYRPHSHAVLKPAFTSSQSGNHFMTPKDVATVYDLNTAYNSGYTGLGQTIVVAGQSLIATSDISNFQTAAGVALNPPNVILVPNSGGSLISSGDESESDLDVEYSSSIANKATIDFVYTGSNSNLGVFQSVIYAIQQDLGQIITLSYGECEPDLGQYYFNYFESYFQQAAAQGQTVINSAGDSGSTACYGDGNTVSVNGVPYQEQVAVSYPASSAYVTALGGTEFPAADVTAASPVTASTTYWSGAASTTGDTLSSALSYIPEQAWNDDSAGTSTSSGGLSSGGGGVSTLSTRPTWQTGVPGIPSGSFRLVPDVSLDSSPNNAGYLYCSSDSTGVGFSGSCTNGFRVSSAYSNSGGLTVAGGTSFAAPIFAGMLALINQAKGYKNGQGLIGSTLYSLASNSSTYALAFHDVNVANNGNNCTAGVASGYCAGASLSDYLTTAGYDEATGLGSVDLTKLISVWPTSGSSLASASLRVSPSTTTPAVSATDSIAIAVSSSAGGVTPTGTVAVTDNGTAVSGSPFTLSGGSYTYSYSSAAGGVHTLIFTYSGDSNYASVKNTQILNVGNSSFTLSVTSPTITTGSSGTVTVTVTPVGGYTGTVQLNLGGSASNSSNVEITNTCFTNTPYSITIPSGTTAPVSASYTVYTSASTCAANGLPTFFQPGSKTAARRAELSAPASPAHKRSLPIAPAATFAGLIGLLALSSFKRRSRLLRGGLALGIVLMLGLSGLGLSGCSSGAAGNTTTTGGSGSTTSTSNVYNFVIYANDSVDLAITNGTNGTPFTITLQ
jgi:subtilase family serine protease